MDAYLIANIQDSLSLFLYDNAKFLCERLVASFPSEQNTYLLATCYRYCNQAYRSYHLLQGCTTHHSRYLLALCCLQLGKLQEAEVALLKFGESEVPNGAAGYYLLGKICKLSGSRSRDAARYFSKALQLKPLLWSAYEELCALGEDEAAADFCKNVLGTAMSSEASSMQNTASAMSADASCAESTPSSAAQLLHGVKVADRNGVLPSTGRMWPSPSAFCTPSPQVPPSGPPGVNKKDGGSVFPGFQAGAAGSGRSLSMGPHKIRDEERGKMRKLSGRLGVEPSSLVRRSARLASKDSVPSLGPTKSLRDLPSDHKTPSHTLLSPPLHPHLALPSTPSAMNPDRRPKDANTYGDGRTTTLKVLAPIFEGYRHLCLYRCHEAVEAFQRLSPEQSNTGWVQHQIGRAHFEVVEYKLAAEAFEACRRRDMHRVEGMEVYSTVLWHMKDETKLNHLAQEIHSLDRLSPHAWCVLGNCLSLQKDHENALTTFQRALQLDPTFTYAYTLCGHEYFANEDFDKGLTCYQNAIRTDPRHYNALYGIGQINFHQEKYEQAMKHFEMALSINGRSSVLKCYLGMTLHRLQRYPEALAWLKDAIASDPKNPLARYEKANLLISMEMHQDALQELQDLKDIAPREASVWFTMGKLFKKLNNLDAAMMHYQMARDLNPSSSDVSLIKSAIEKLEVADENEDEDL